MTRKQVQTSLGTWAKEAELGLAIETTQKSSLQACQASPLAGNVVWPGRWRPRLQVVNMQMHFHLVIRQDHKNYHQLVSQNSGFCTYPVSIPSSNK